MVPKPSFKKELKMKMQNRVYSPDDEASPGGSAGDSSSSSDDAWLEEVEREVAELETPPEIPTKVVEPTATETPPSVPPPTPAPVAKDPAVPASPTPAPEPTPTPAPVTPPPPPPPAPTAEEVTRQAAERRRQFEDQLVQRYALSEDDATSIIAEPEKTLPKLLAKAHMSVVEDTMQWVQANFGRMVEGVTRQQTVIQESVSKFYKEFPELVGDDKGPTVARILQGVRAANPNATTEQVIREGGIAALVALRIPLPERLTKQHTADLPTQRPVVGTHTPPGGSGPAPVPKPPVDNIFTVIAEEDLQDR
jgi:hypothetical protein